MPFDFLPDEMDTAWAPTGGETDLKPRQSLESKAKRATYIDMATASLASLSLRLRDLALRCIGLVEMGIAADAGILVGGDATSASTLEAGAEALRESRLRIAVSSFWIGHIG